MMLKIVDEVGTFAENKEKAKALRSRCVLPALKRGEEVHFDFEDVSLATQSFVHALIAQGIRSRPDALDLMEFRHCSPNVRSIIEVVVSYCQDEWDAGMGARAERVRS